MNSKQFWVLGGICVALLAGCASTGDTSATAPAQASAAADCRSSEPTTGTSIRRRDCSSDAKMVSADDFKNLQRDSVGVGTGIGGAK
ncbi:hypothetical protein GTP91_23880 [Rugamonas sp. FT82W]|uniref:Lipoprotein n=1 Tax=Duganella vulcania TaxID=2692166 RepID=A0A845GBG8_9BURK|nr:hypothetical protein [Duganella vulcania]MYM90198.1 hypothetical protein [Duganella vulcania]